MPSTSSSDSPRRSVSVSSTRVCAASGPGPASCRVGPAGASGGPRRPWARPASSGAAGERRKTSSSRRRPARRSASGRSWSASQAVSSATAAGSGRRRPRTRRGRPPVPARRAWRPGRHVEPRRSAEADLVGWQRPAQLARVPGRHEPAVVDDDDGVGQPLGLLELVGGQDDAAPSSPSARIRHRTCWRPLTSTDAVGSSRKGPGAADQRQGQRQPLLLAARQLAPRRPGPLAEPDLASSSWARRRWP